MTTEQTTWAICRAFYRGWVEPGPCPYSKPEYMEAWFRGVDMRERYGAFVVLGLVGSFKEPIR